MLSRLKTLTLGLPACSKANGSPTMIIAGNTPTLSVSRRSGKPRKPNSSASAARTRPRRSGSATLGHSPASAVSCNRAPNASASPIASAAMTAPRASPRSHGTSTGRRHPISDPVRSLTMRPMGTVAPPNATISWPPLRKPSQSRPPHPGTSREMPIVPPKPTAQNSTTTPSATATRFTSSPPDPLSPGARGTQTKRAPSEARANRGSEREQDRYRDDQLQEVSQQEGPGAELRGGPQVSRENRELREPAEVDEHEAREHTARHTPYARSVLTP